MNNFGKNLEKLRKDRKLTQQQCAAAIGIKVRRYQAWEEGRALPQMKLLPQICEAFQYFDIFSLITDELPAT
jgi:transcriptional regulator with XRE-family HTH domain